MLKNGNHKLGKEIFNFNLPRTTCTNRTELCNKYCYARYGSFGFKNVKNCMEQNLEETKKDDFVAKIDTQLKSMPSIRYVRLHASGDFYNQNYYNKWNEIAAANPNITFLAYTRNTNIDFRDRVGNFVVYQSIDKTTKALNPTLSLKSYIFDVGDTDNKHMAYNKDKDYFVCDSKCHSCKFCFAGKENVGFQLRK